MIEVYKVKVCVEDSYGSNVSTKYFMTIEKACEYLEEKRDYYFEEYDESDDESDSDDDDSDDSDDSDEEKQESKDDKQESKENIENNESDNESEDSDYPDEKITVEFLTSLFEEDRCKFRPHTVFEHEDDEYITATISKIFINN